MTDNIGLHLKNIFASGELEKDSVTEKISATASDGKNYMTQFYNLDTVISVGYRVNSIRATQFRQWATRVLREFSIRGYVLDENRMENSIFLGELYHIKKLQPNWIAVFFMYALGWLLLALRFAPCSNVLASAMLVT